ncbi:MAG: ABC transporter ATP-binding protein [Bdellovibrionales bacterium]|nr:ABC transporter ATP-binding protein [Bdellovibrionales bacterium]
MRSSLLKPLVVSNLTKRYGDFEAVKGVSFSLEPGEIFGLLGPNGAGKTSIISVIVTLTQPSSGDVEVFEQSVSDNPREAKVHTGLVPQELINHGYFDVEEVLKFYSGYFGVTGNKSRIDFLLDRLQLWEHRKKKVKQLSGGMKRRLLIAKALVHEPKLLLLDEPTAGVDIELRESLWEFVTDLRKEGLTVLLTTHYLEEAEQLCDRVAILHHGEMRKIGPTKQLIEGLTQRNILIQLKSPLSQFQHPYLIDNSGAALHFRVPSGVGAGDLLAESQLDLSNVVDMKIEEGSLEEAFRSVLSGTRGELS